MASEGETIGRLRDSSLDAFTVSEFEMFLTENGYEAVVATVNQRAGGLEYFFAAAQALRTTDERSGSTIRWMDLTAYLERESGRRKGPVKQVEFRGESMTAQTLMALRDRIVPPPTG